MSRRSEKDMLGLILDVARKDERVRAVILNGSRTNPNARKDFFQDFDIVFVVTDVEPFKKDAHWIDQFGERMILQLPDDMQEPPQASGSFAYLMQFTDGNRIDLTLFPLDSLQLLQEDSLSVSLMDKDGNLPHFDPPSEKSYLPVPPSAKAFADCCNEFWWVCPYVAKGLWRDEIIYARYLLDGAVREQLMKMLEWYVGVRTEFKQNPGKFGKHYKTFLEPALWSLLENTYADAGTEHTWDALFCAGDLFRTTAKFIADQFGYPYPEEDDHKVTAHLRHVRSLLKDAREMY